MSKLHDMAEISQNQLHSVQSQQQARDREMKSLRQQLREFQVQTDEHALIGGFCRYYLMFLGVFD